MKTLNSLILICIISSVFTNNVNAQQTKPDTKDDEQAIRSLSMKWLELDKKHDVQNMAALFVKDGIVNREHQEPAVGISAIQALYTKDFKENPKIADNWTTDRVEIAVSGELAIEYGSWNSSGRGLDGTGSDQGKFLTVYHKVNGTWKVAIDCSWSTKPVNQEK